MHQLELEIEQERNMADNLVSAMQPDLRERYVQLKNQNMQFQVRMMKGVLHVISLVVLKNLVALYIQKCRKIHGLGCVNHTRAWVRVTQPSPPIFLHICKLMTTCKEFMGHK